MTWEALTAVGTALTALVIVVTAIIGLSQLQQIRAQRRDAAAVELMRSFQDADFTYAWTCIGALPPGISAAQLRAHGAKCVESAQILALRFEMLGVLVHRGAIGFDVTEELCGGGAVAMWQCLRDFAYDTRQAQSYPTYLEWFQWLAEQFEKRDRFGQTPAYELHREWTPHA
jgi:hypothetical protein